MKFENLTNKPFNRLTALEQIGHTKQKSPLWKCLCLCGKITWASSNSRMLW